MSSEKNYSFFDRFLHYIAFANPLIQKALCELENDLFKDQIEPVDSCREVFVTGLPRGGTTLVLNLLYGTDEFVTFTYRHMPFILAPILWSKVSHPFQKAGEIRERAHGDGVEVSFDSPEAFEEVIWLAYLKKKIVMADVLLPLTDREYTEEFSHAFRYSIRKLLSHDRNAQLRHQPLRYLSKNNANVSRIGVLTEIFPSSTILVPFRNPLAQISSLMEQHERFSKKQRKDKFSRRYMKWLGHFEFGENFKPINFDAWLDGKEIPWQIDKNFWLEYWTAGYRYVLKHKNENVHFLDFNELLRDGESSLQRVADCVGVHQKKKLVAGAETLRLPTTQPIESGECSTTNLRAAKEVHEQLKSIAI